MSKPKKVNINKNNVSDKERVLDIIAFGQLFLPEDFMKSTPAPYHYELNNLLLDQSKKRNCIILPRGHSKSTLAKTALLHHLYFNPEGKKEFIAWVAEEQSQAIDHIKYIQNHIEVNPALNYYFGDIRGSKWTEKEFTTSKGDRVIAKGTSQRLRGRSQLGLRYTKIVLDDFESELNTKTPERRDEIKKWIVSTVFPALEESPGREGWIWLCGTIVHYDSFLQMVVDGSKQANKEERKYPWDVTFYRALEDGKSIWPEQFPISKLESKKREFIEAGLVNKFAQEYMNDARDLSAASFKTDRIKYHDGTYKVMDNYSYLVIRNEAIPINVYIGVDIAATATQTSDFQVIMVIGVDSNKNRYVLEYYRERIPTFDLPQKIIDLARKYSPVRRVTIETVAAQEMVRDMVTRMATEDRRLIPGIFKGVKPPAGIKKADRLETSLGPVVNNKKLYIRREMTELVDEMFEHPVPKNDDLMDALYYADYYAKAPISSAISIQDMKQGRKGSKVKSYYNWMTGARR